jgi:hypothetical protein
VALSKNFSDGTFNGAGGSSLFGGSSVESGGGSAFQERWTAARAGDLLDLSNILQEEAQYSAKPGEGGLYTAKGLLLFDSGIDTGPAAGIVSVGLSWDIDPALTPAFPPPPLSIAMRGRPDGRMMLMEQPVSGLGFYSWAAQAATFVTPGITTAVNNTGFDPIPFALEALTATTFTWYKTYSVVNTYTPPPDDPETGYYPVRGSTTTTANASVSLEFTA